MLTIHYMYSPKRQHALAGALIFFLGACILLLSRPYILSCDLSDGSQFAAPLETHSHFPPDRLHCETLPGAEDVVVVLKTDSTELQDKMPIHISTTSRCSQYYLIFSDHGEHFENITGLDALEFMDDKIKNQNADFELWRRVQKGGRAALLPEELSGSNSIAPVDKSGNVGNPGWKLDKWKFLPMMNRTVSEFPNKKWYLFVEVDTYIFWQTILNYLAYLDHSESYYIGDQIFYGDTMFAHGGTGYALSQSALQSVAKQYRSDPARWDKIVYEHWAGDVVLGQASRETGVKHVSAWPIFQGQGPGAVPHPAHQADTNLWCRPMVLHHHLSPSVVEDIWLFERQWVEKTAKDDASLHLCHKDVFAQFIVPRLPNVTQINLKLEWNNQARLDSGFVNTLDDYRTICLADSGCLQYLIDLKKRCRTGEVPALGRPASGIDSGWVVERISSWEEPFPACASGPGWITYNESNAESK